MSFTSHTDSFTDGVNRVIGWDFTTQTTPLFLTALGFFDEGQNGLLVAHEVALYDTSSQSLITSVTVPGGTGAGLDGFFRTVGVAPVALSPNTTYTLAATLPANADRWVWDDGVAGVSINSISTDPDITTGNLPARFIDVSSTLAFPNNRITDLVPGDPRNWFIGPNATVSTVPEPSSAILLLFGALFCFRRRSIRVQERNGSSITTDAPFISNRSRRFVT